MNVHHEKRIVHCSPARMFAVIVDVESYPQFLPGWRDVHIRSDDNNLMIVDQQIGIGPVSWRFTSSASYNRPEQVTIRSQDGPFRALEIDWKLSGADNNSCAIELKMQVEFSSALVQRLMKRMFVISSRNIVSLFEQRARVYQRNVISSDAE